MKLLEYFQTSQSMILPMDKLPGQTAVVPSAQPTASAKAPCTCGKGDCAPKDPIGSLLEKEAAGQTSGGADSTEGGVQ